MSLMAAPAPPSELPPGEEGLEEEKSGSRVGFRRDREWIIWVGGKIPPSSEEIVDVAFGRPRNMGREREREREIESVCDVQRRVLGRC